MKKIIPLFLCLVFLCSCSKTDYSEIESRAIVSAIGIDKEKENITVSMELVNTKDSEETAENQIIFKSGKNFLDAVSNISASVSKNLFYSQCATIILGEGLTKEDVQNVFKFIFDGNEFTLLLKVVATKNAKELLTVKPKSEAVLGFEIMSVLNSREKNLSLGYYNSFINVGGRRDVTPYLYALPYFEVSGEKEKKIYSLSGLKLYKDDSENIILKKEEASIFEIFSNSFKSGEISINIKEIPTTVQIKKSKNKQKAFLENDLLNINFELSQKLNTKNRKVNIKEYRTALNEELQKFIALSKEKELDVFFIKELLKREDPSLFNKIDKEFNRYYKNAKFNIKMDIKEEANA